MEWFRAIGTLPRHPTQVLIKKKPPGAEATGRLAEEEDYVAA